MTRTLFWPNVKKYLLEIEVEGTSDDFTISSASAFVPAISSWIDCKEEISKDEFYQEFIMGELILIEANDDRSDEYYDRTVDDNLANEAFSLGTTLMKAGGM